MKSVSVLRLARDYDAARRRLWAAALLQAPALTDLAGDLDTARAADIGFALTGALRLPGMLAAVDARNRLTEANLGMVAVFARHLAGRCLLDDLVQEGTLGLLRACDTFAPERGWKFSTYSAWWIRRAMHEATAAAGPLRVPVHALRAWREVGRVEAAWELRHGRRPTDAELAAAIGVGARGLAAAQSVGALLEHEEVTPESATHDPYEGAERDRLMRERVADLPHADRVAVTMRGDGATFNAIAEALETTPYLATQAWRRGSQALRPHFQG